MTPRPLRSLKTAVLRRLEARFDLEPGEYAAQLQLDPLITLASHVDELLAEYKQVQGIVSVTATGAFYAHTVPAGKRWTVYAHHTYLSTGVWTYGNLEIRDNSAALNMPWGPIATLTNAADDFDQAPILEEGDQFGVTCDGWTSIGNLVQNLWIKEEDAF